MSNIEIIIFSDPDSLQKNAAEQFISAARRAIAERNSFSVVLSGGNTPAGLYKNLTRSPLRDQVSWEKVHFFWGDERCVPPDHPESNYGNARKVLLDPLAISEDHIHRVKGELDVKTAAQDYRLQLHDFEISQGQLNSPWPVFDLVLLGLGEDGHIASIFPGLIPPGDQPVMATSAEYQGRPTQRVSLTPFIFNDSREILIIVTGDNKAQAVAGSFSKSVDPTRWPARWLKPTSGRLVWMVDQAAASALPPGVLLEFGKEVNQ